MRAMVIPSFGGPDVFEERDVEHLDPGPGEVLVRIVASGTNPVEAKVRAAGSWAVEPPAVIGYDASGVVEEVGPGVVDFQEGDEVFYTPEIAGNHLGTYAEYNVVPTYLLAHKPAGLTHQQAAAIPLAGGTAWEAVIRRIMIAPGETILINGAAGGVGHFAVQFARIAGARVLGCAGPDNQDFLRDLGAEPIDYTEGDPAEAALELTDGQGVEALFDMVGGESVAASLSALEPFGRVASILPVQGDLTPAYRNNITLYGIFLTRERVRLEEMAPVFERGQVEPHIEQVLPLEQVSKAHERLDTGHGRGKIVLEVQG